eukprot:scaffold203252_cov15-Tisochrysis_lutea.AAC.1
MTACAGLEFVYDGFASSLAWSLFMMAVLPRSHPASQVYLARMMNCRHRHYRGDPPSPVHIEHLGQQDRML